MRRYFESLRPAMCQPLVRFRMVFSLFGWIGRNIVGTSKSLITRSASLFSSPGIDIS